MNTTKIKTQNIAVEFAKATKQKNIELLYSLLDEKGEFEIQDLKNETVEANKSVFLKWYKTKLEATNITEIVYDQCMFCQIGNSVVIFNNGEFPRMIKDSSERVKTGIMIDAKNGKITTLKFCFSFIKTENKYKFEINLEEMLKSKKLGLCDNPFLNELDDDAPF